MITYELAKQLKDSGFPDNSKFYTERPDMGIDSDGKFRDFAPYDCYVPTLSELIEACGDIILWKNGEFWEADIFNGEGEIYIDDYFDTSQEYKTPEEAVAKLWLELNKK